MVVLKLIGISILLLGLGVAGIAIKIWAKKTANLLERVHLKVLS